MSERKSGTVGGANPRPRFNPGGSGRHRMATRARAGGRNGHDGLRGFGGGTNGIQFARIEAERWRDDYARVIFPVSAGLTAGALVATFVAALIEHVLR